MEFLATLGHYSVVALTFILIFSALIILHELGHFWMARFTGAKVEEFGFGLPPKIWGKKTKHQLKISGKNGKQKTITEEMEWTFNAIPFGGFVRLFGEDAKEAIDNPRAFANLPLFSRILITIGGVAMNFILAFVLFVFVAMIGFSPLVDPNLHNHPKFEEYFSDGHLSEWTEKGFYTKAEEGVFIAAVAPDSPAAVSDLRAGDQVIQIDATPIENREHFETVQNGALRGAGFHYAVRRFDPETHEFFDLVKVIRPIQEEGENKIGVILLEDFYYPLQKIQYGITQAPKFALENSGRYMTLSWNMVKNIGASTFGKIFQLQKPEIPEGVGGPVAILDNTNTLVEIGDISKILQFAAILSLSLAVINLVPFPALDGGRLFFQILEGLLFLLLLPFRRLFPKLKNSHRIPPHWETPFHVVGYGILMIFIVAITWNDLVNIFF